MSKAYKTDKTIDGVKCEVAACDFHTPDDKCSASGIHVGSKHSSTSQQTDCETFCNKEDCCCDKTSTDSEK